ncbi:insulinase family protein [bacterium]|nr:insulinase family protein [bacterium]
MKRNGGAVKSLAIAFVCGCCILRAHAELQPFQCETYVLDNGMRVVFLEKRDAPLVALRVFVKNTGSVYEREYLGCGISHYIEHLVAGGTTTRRSEAEASRLIKKMGDEYNAYTTLDHTCYHIETTRAFLRDAAQLLTEFVKDCAFLTNEVEREKGVITQEIRMGKESPERAHNELQSELMHLVSPARVPVIGYLDNFQRLTRDDVLKYHRERYVANNMVVVLVGDVTRDEARAVLDETFGTVPRGPDTAIPLPPEPPVTAPRAGTRRFNVKQAHVSLSFPGVRQGAADAAALDLLGRVLSDGESSILARSIKRDKQLVFSVWAGNWAPSFGPGAFEAGFTCDETNVSAAAGAVIAELLSAAAGALTHEQVARAQRRALVSYTGGLQSVGDIAGDMGGGMISLGDPNYSIRYLNAMMRLTTADLQRVASAYLDTNKLITAVLLPNEEAVPRKEPVARIHSEDTYSFTVTRLSNGVRLALRRDDRLPLAALRLYAPGGLVYETRGNNGISSFIAGMLTRGTDTRSADEIARTVESLGASLSYNATREALHGAADCLGAHLPTVVELLADTLMNATFPADEIEKQRRLALAAIRTERDQWHREGMLNFSEVFYKGFPYAMPLAGSTAAVERFDADGLRAFHRGMLQPSNIVIAVAGSFDPAELTALFEKHFAACAPRAAALMAPALPAYLDDAGTATIGTPRKQATIILGCHAPDSLSDERCPLIVAESHLGGFSGALFTALRGKDDLVYVVQPLVQMDAHAGALLALAQCEPRNTAAVIDKMTNAILSLAAEPMTDAGLADAKNAVIIPFLAGRETLGQQADMAALWEYRGRGATYPREYVRHIEAVTADDVLRAARRRLESFTCVVTTPDDAVQRAKDFLAAYPDAEAQDVYKALYQGVCGPGHLGADRERLRASVVEEWNAIEAKQGPLFLPIGVTHDWAWLNLKALKAQGGSLEEVVDALYESIRRAGPRHETFSQNWARVAAAFASGEVKIKDDSWRAFDERMALEDFPVVHHTDTFIRKYAPAYRVVSQSVAAERMRAKEHEEEGEE